MRILIRVMGLSIIGILFMIMLLYLGCLNIREDELNTIVSLAMTQTQMIMEEQIEDNFYHTANARETFYSNSAYFNYFVNSLKPLIETDSQYEVNLLKADVEKGILDVEVRCHFSFLGFSKTLKTRKTSVIDVLLKDGER